MRRSHAAAIPSVLFLVFLAVNLAAVDPARAGDRVQALLRIQLVDKDFLTPVETFAVLEFQWGSRIASATNTSQRKFIDYFWSERDYTISVKAIAPDGRIAYDQRTIRYIRDDDPVPDGTYDLVFVLDFGPPPETPAADPAPNADSTDSGSGDEPEDSLWQESIDEAAEGDRHFPGLEESEGELVIPPDALARIRARQPGEIPPGERRIIGSGFELIRGQVDDRSSPALIDPEHVVIAVQFPNGESRVLDGEAAILVMRERGFLEEDGSTLTASGRRGWESPYITVADDASYTADTNQDVASEASADAAPVLLEQMAIPARGGSVTTTTTFSAGQYYLIEVSGVITSRQYNSRGVLQITRLHDPVYNISQEVHSDPSESWHPGPDEARYPVSNLRIDDDNMICATLNAYIDDKWRLMGQFDRYRTDHVYRFRYEGSGRPLTFFFCWHDDEYIRGEGAFTLRISTWPEAGRGGDVATERRPS